MDPQLLPQIPRHLYPAICVWGVLLCNPHSAVIEWPVAALEFLIPSSPWIPIVLDSQKQLRKWVGGPSSSWVLSSSYFLYQLCENADTNFPAKICGCITSDNGSNICCTTHILKWMHLPCLVTVLTWQLSIQWKMNQGLIVFGICSSNKIFHTLEITGYSFSSAHAQWRNGDLGRAYLGSNHSSNRRKPCSFVNGVNRHHILCQAMCYRVCQLLLPFWASGHFSPLLSATSIIIWPQLWFNVGFSMLLACLMSTNFNWVVILQMRL